MKNCIEFYFLITYIEPYLLKRAIFDKKFPFGRVKDPVPKRVICKSQDDVRHYHIFEYLQHSSQQPNAFIT